MLFCINHKSKQIENTSNGKEDEQPLPDSSIHLYNSSFQPHRHIRPCRKHLPAGQHTHLAIHIQNLRQRTRTDTETDG